MRDDWDEALMLIGSIMRALDSGIRHTSLDGRELTTALDVVEALLEDGSILLGNDGERPPRMLNITQAGRAALLS